MNKRQPFHGRKAAALLMCLCLLLGMAGGARAEENVVSAMQPLMDLTAAAAMRVGETPETVTPDSALSQSFVYSFFLLGQQADASLGITAEMLNDTSLQAEYLGRAFASPLPELNGIMAFEQDYDYIGVRVMATDVSEDGTAAKIIGDLYQSFKPLEGMTETEYSQVRWLDKRAVVEMRKDEAAPGGWKLISFNVDAELQMEDAAQAYFAEIMVEYINTEKGFSLQYPAVFKEELLKEIDGGVSASLPDGTASFFAKRAKNDAGWTLDTLLAGKKQENPAAETNINDISGCGRMVTTLADGSTQVDLFIVTDQWVYQAQLIYAPSLAKDFALYSDYMMNSFTADELGIG